MLLMVILVVLRPPIPACDPAPAPAGKRALSPVAAAQTGYVRRTAPAADG